MPTRRGQRSRLSLPVGGFRFAAVCMHVRVCDGRVSSRPVRPMCCALSAVEMTKHFDDAADGDSRSWIFHRIIYIIPFLMRRRGSLWPMSTARLEARGARLKPTWRKQVNKRRARGVVSRTIEKKPAEAAISASRGPSTKTFRQGYADAPEAQCLAVCKLREKQLHGSLSSGVGAGQIQLRASKKARSMSLMGRITKAKLELDAPVLIDGKEAAVPKRLDNTCEDVFFDLLRGAYAPYYDARGRCRTLE